ncbi:Receptor-like protein 12 [Vitis vinifera]|uniref:Receptor-like protein 12 n=1 Tax=Vitis vinifera TaxID=29760 RepID=A0A438DQ49_VITVI|nr:Receptor-like protein 12 [Vitis vinifera]
MRNLKFHNIHGKEPYPFSTTMTNKGMTREYELIPDILIAIDLSSNRFHGEIPESIGNPNGLRWLNLSNNALIGAIPTSLANLTLLEALDLSQNKLSREIPQQLVQLTFLAFFNVSHNHLTGPIPQGNNLQHFQGLPLMGTQDCVEVLCQGHVEVLSNHHQHLHPPNKVQLVNLIGNLY